MLLPFFGYVLATTALAAVAVLVTGLVSTATLEKGRHHPTPVIAPKVKVEMQRHLPVAKKASPAKDDSPVVSTAKAGTKKKQALQSQSACPSAQQLPLWERAGLC